MKTPENNRGSVLLFVLVFLMVLTTILVATSQWLSRQAKHTVDRAQANQAFALADAGIYYAAWLLDPTGGNTLPSALVNILGREVRRDSGELIGTYDLTFSDTQATSVVVRAAGRDTFKQNLCQTVTSILQQDGGVTAGLLGYWPFNDGPSGAQALDASGSNNHGTLTSMNPPTDWLTNAAPTTFLNSYALDFDGVNDRVALSDIDFTNAMSGSLWVKFNTVSPAQILINTRDLEYQMQMRGTAGAEKFRVQVTAGTGTDITESTTSAAADAWYHVAWTYDGANLRLFVNGTEETTVIQNTAAGAIIDGTHGGTIGASDTGSTGTNGAIDDVRIYNRALSSLELSQLAAGSGQAYWRITNWQHLPGDQCD